jgi:hypothetical protein
LLAVAVALPTAPLSLTETEWMQPPRHLERRLEMALPLVELLALVDHREIVELLQLIFIVAVVAVASQEMAVTLFNKEL